MFKNAKNDYIGWLVLIGIVDSAVGNFIFQQRSYFLPFHFWRNDLFRP